ncbi:BT4734/BF3469 family protein [Rufibacter soli]
MTTVSLYKNIAEVTNGTSADITAVLEGIRNGRWKDQVEAVRAVETVTERRALKKLLPYFTVSGTFSTRNEKGLLEHSGLVALDIDHDLSKMEEVAVDPYTFACVVSAGGDGFFTIVRIPGTNHNGSFRALQRYYLTKYGVTIDSLPDVSRPRFVSYDPNLYLNPESEIFTEVYTPEKKKSAPASYPAPTVPASYGHAALHTAVRKVLEAPDGFKHKTLNTMAFLCGGYVATGLLQEHEVIQALEGAIASRGNVESMKEAIRTITVAVRDGQKKPILPEPLEYVVRVGKRDHDSQDIVTSRLVVATGGNTPAIAQAVAEIYSEKEHTIQAFWHVDINEEKATYKLVLSRVKYMAFLEEAGFRKFKAGRGYTTVRVQHNVVTEVTRAEIKDYVMGYLNELPFEFDHVFRSQLIDQVQREHRQFFDEGMLEFLRELPDNFLRDTKATAYFFFANGYVEVTKAGMVLRDYSCLPGLIWEKQIVQREFNLMDADEVNDECDFYRFLFNISGEDPERLVTLLTSIGYLLHGYKAPANPKVICLVDEAISDVPSGGTGKSLVFEAIGHMREMVRLDGKNIDFKDRFAMQEVGESTRVVFFDDWDGKRLSFDRLFVMATGEMKVHKMYLGAVSIPYQRSAKIGLATNDMVGGEGDSNARRKFEVEIAPYYSRERSPVDEFGHEFFNDWTEADWNTFDNLMLGCTKLFLTKGLKAAAPINLQRRKLLQATNTEFAQFCDELTRDFEYSKKLEYDSFIGTYGFDTKQITQVRFSRWLKAYASLTGLGYEERKNRTLGVDKDQYFFTFKRPSVQV